MQVFLDAPQDFEHVCVIARTLEALGVRRCHVHDPNRLIRSRYGKSRTRRLHKVSVGAFFRVAFERVEEPTRFLRSQPGRKVATVPAPSATSLAGILFLPDDLIVFGSEGGGNSPEVLALCDEHVTIPQRGVPRASTSASPSASSSSRPVARRRVQKPYNRNRVNGRKRKGRGENRAPS
ncbi:MAG: TrmH family RNA methyltransferase [Actinomycetota bacterium]|nr:TrmH family RNA methyltransferase [Actinomycetota bacterium]